MILNDQFTNSRMTSAPFSLEPWSAQLLRVGVFGDEPSFQEFCSSSRDLAATVDG